MAITRQIGEVFEYKGKTLIVKKSMPWHSCHGCAFNDKSHPSLSCYENEAKMLEKTGECNGMVRTDGTYVIFSLVRK